VRAGGARGAVGACETARNPSGSQPDRIPPSISLSTTADTQQIATGLSFNVDATDNLGLKDIRLTYSGRLHRPDRYHFQLGGHELQHKGESVTFPPTSGAGGFITMSAARDARNCAS